MNAIGQLKFRGTSVLFRFSQSVIDNYKKNFKFNIIKNLQSEKQRNLKRSLDENGNDSFLKHIYLLNFLCLDCYELATHTVKVKR